MGLPLPEVINLNRSRQRAQYWKQNDKGEWLRTGPLPADELSIAYYFRKGFKAKKPTGNEQEDGSSIRCPICEKEVASAFGLQSHLRVHITKSKKEEKT